MYAYVTYIIENEWFCVRLENVQNIQSHHIRAGEMGWRVRGTWLAAYRVKGQNRRLSPQVHT